jgi:hypothetical protein
LTKLEKNAAQNQRSVDWSASPIRAVHLWKNRL